MTHLNQRSFSERKAVNFAPASGRQPGADRKVPNGRGFIALLEAFRATGGSAPGDIVGRLLEEHQVGNAVSLAKLIHTGQVFGFEWRASLWIPMFQFDADDLTLKAGARRVRAELPSLWSGWDLAAWFALPTPQLHGCSPVDLLDTNIDSVLQAARSPDFVAASAVPPCRHWHEVAAHV